MSAGHPGLTGVRQGPPPPPGQPPPPPPPTSTSGTPLKPALTKLGGKPDRDAILRAIKGGGFQLRPTQTADKSRPIIHAEGEEVPTVRLEDPKPAALPVPAPAPSLPRPPLASTSRPPPPPGQPAPPPPPTTASATSIKPALTKLGGKPDRDAILRAIKGGGVKLRKTTTNDKSGLILDEEQLAVINRSTTPNSVNDTQVEEDFSGSRHSLDSQGFSVHISDSSSDRVLSSASESEYDVCRNRPVYSMAAVPPPPPLQPPPSNLSSSSVSPTSSTMYIPSTSQQPMARTTPNIRLPSLNVDPQKKSDFIFDENSLRVSKEDLEAEIPAGSAQSRIAAFKKFEQNAQPNNRGGTLPRRTPPTKKEYGTLESSSKKAPPTRTSLPSIEANRGTLPAMPKSQLTTNGPHTLRSQAPSTTHLPIKNNIIGNVMQPISIKVDTDKTIPNPRAPSMVKSHTMTNITNTTPSDTSNCSKGPYKFQRKASADISQPQGLSPSLTQRNYQSALSPIQLNGGELSPASSTSSYHSAGVSSIASSTSAKDGEETNRSRAQNKPRGESSGVGTDASSASSSLSPPLRSASASPAVYKKDGNIGIKPPPIGGPPPVVPTDSMRRTFHLRSGTAGNDHSANFARLRQSFANRGGATVQPQEANALRKSASSSDANNNSSNESPPTHKSGEALWKNAAFAKKMSNGAEANSNISKRNVVTPVKINAPWYKKENYDADGNVKTTTSVPIRVQSKTAQKESNSDSDPSIVSDANNLDPSALRSNYKFSIDVNKDSPIKMVRR